MAFEHTTDTDLSRQCRRGAAGAWTELVRRHTPAVYRMARRMLRNGPEAEDVCQKVFLRAYRSFDSFDATRPIAPWIAGITYNECLRQVSAASRVSAVAFDPEAAERMQDGEEPGPERRVADRETGTRVEEAVDDLPAQDRALVLMRYREGLSDVEIAEATGMALGTVRVRLHRTRAKLRQALGPEIGRERT